MSLLNIKTIGDPILKKKAAVVEKIDSSTRRLLDDMAETLYNAEGVGLAAPQVGVSQRIIVIDVGDGLIELINPEIVRTEGNMLGFEGCLSIPGMSGEVERFANVSVKFLNRRGKQQRITAKGDLLSRCIQHEFDHLEGLLFVDKAKSITKQEDNDD